MLLEVQLVWVGVAPVGGRQRQKQVLLPGFCCVRVGWRELLQVEWRQLLQCATQVACSGRQANSSKEESLA